MDQTRTKYGHKFVTCELCGKKMRSDTLKRHLKTHKKNCIFCKLLFSIVLLTAHIPVCSQNPINMPKVEPIIDHVNMQIVKYEEEKKSQNEIEDAVSKQKRKWDQMNQLPAEDKKLALISFKQYYLEKVQPSLMRPIENLYPWQEQIIQIMEEGNWNDRTINVLYDPEGGIGKTSFAKHMLINNNVLCIFGGSKPDLQTAYEKIMENLEINFWQIFINLERAINYTPNFIEKIKDGLMEGYNHYKPKLTVPKNNMFVFCNNLITVDKISKNRLQYFKVDNNKCLINFIPNAYDLAIKYVCRFCNDHTSTKKFNIDRHEKSCGRNYNVDNTIVTSFNCDCPYSYVFPHKLESNELGEYKCTFCNDFKCFIKNELKTHHVICKAIINKNNISVKNTQINQTVNNYIGFCKICNKSCNNVICQQCANMKSENKIECRYCKFEILPSEMNKHIELNHSEYILTKNLVHKLCKHCFESYKNEIDHMETCKAIKKCIYCNEIYYNQDKHNETCDPK